MLVAHLDPLASSLFSLMAIASLLLAFVMLGSRWLNNYLYAFAAESWVIAALSAAVGFYGNYPELYLIAILTALFRGLLLPYLVWRIIRRLNVAREIHEILQPSSALVVGAVGVVFALAVSYRHRSVPRARRHRGRAGSDDHAVDEADRISDARGATRGVEPNSRSAGP